MKPEARDRVRRPNKARGQSPEAEIIGPKTASGGRTKPEPRGQILGPETVSGGQIKLEARDRSRRPNEARGRNHWSLNGRLLDLDVRIFYFVICPAFK